jgi:ribonuclease VapC
MTRNALVLDGWAIIAYLENQPGGERVEELLIENRKSDSDLLMSVVNAGEVWYSLARGYSPAVADEKIAELLDLGIEFVDADWPTSMQAGVFKARGNIAYADCFAAALAKMRKADLVTGNPEFKQVENEVKLLRL